MQAPVFGADVASFDAAEALRMRGVKQVVQIPHAVVVVADSWWRAKQAAAKVQVTWTATPHDQTSSADIARQADEALAAGKPITEVARSLGVSPATPHRWRVRRPASAMRWVCATCFCPAWKTSRL